jgi:hypothetical protein
VDEPIRNLITADPADHERGSNTILELRVEPNSTLQNLAVRIALTYKHIILRPSHATNVGGPVMRLY